MKTFSQFVNEASLTAREREKNYGSEPLPRYRPDRHMNPFHDQYDPPPEHDKLHDTFNKTQHEHLKRNPGSPVQHIIHAYKKVKEVHGEDGFKTLVSDHQKLGMSRNHHEALRALSKEK